MSESLERTHSFLLMQKVSMLKSSLGPHSGSNVFSVVGTRFMAGNCLRILQDAWILGDGLN